MLRDALGSQFQRSIPEYLDGMITVVSVKMSPDLRIAKVYVSIYRSATDPDLLIKRLNTHMPEIRKRLAGEVEMKFVPELRFYRDDTLDAAERIGKLLQSVREQDEARNPQKRGSDDEAHGGEESDDAHEHND